MLDWDFCLIVERGLGRLSSNQKQDQQVASTGDIWADWGGTVSRC